MTMRLYVYVLEAKGLPIESCFVKLQLGKSKSKTRIVRNRPDPIWNEEFVFRVHDLEDELIVSVFHHGDNPRLFHISGYLVGEVRIPVWNVANEENQTLPPTWFSLEKPKTSKYIANNCGKILLTLSQHGRGDVTSANHSFCAYPHVCTTDDRQGESPNDASLGSLSPTVQPTKVLRGKKFMKFVTSHLDRILHTNWETCKCDESLDLNGSPSGKDDYMRSHHHSSCSFDEALEMMHSGDSEQEMPENLQGGILLDQTYVIPSKDLNSHLFAPHSEFRRTLAELERVTDMQEGPWTWKPGDSSCLIRAVTYVKPANKLVKAVKATEEQSYVRAANGEFAILVHVNTPDVPYGNSFRVELLYKVMPGPELSSGEESSHLVISWGINFYRNIIMKSMIEGGARQGLKESFDHFASLLSQDFRVLDPADSLDKDSVLESLQKEHQSDWELGIPYFWNLTVVSTTVMLLYVFIHMLLCKPGEPQGLEFNGLDLPDSYGELITSGILFLLLERVHIMVSHFIEARLCMGSDHGVKARGDGWVVTVAVVEAIDLPSLDTTEFPDPFVVLTCNGKTRTSSVQLQACDPQWNEILEFDATEEPPSFLDVEVLDFDGPFDQTTSFGHAEVNFLKHTSAELADMWIPLQGQLAIPSQSKLHLRIFLENKNGVETIKEYLTKMEKEVGNKLNLQSPSKNLAFQKQFGLPQEEFLIKDYSCYLRRKMPLQGRLFLSARIVGFYANLFGHKTKFFFLWDDIEDIEVHSPSLASVGSPTLVIVLRKGRGLDASHGAKAQDERGRLRFYFQSFASFDQSSRTIMALWKARHLVPNLEALIIGEQSDQENQLIKLDSQGPPFDIEDANMLKIYSADLPVNFAMMQIKCLMKMFDGGTLEHKVMGKSGRLNYTTTQWEEVKPNVYERRVSYKLNHHVSIFLGHVSSTQRRSPIDDRGWVLNEVMALHNIPFGNNFHVHLRYHIEKLASEDDACKCRVYMGIKWLKTGKFQQRITRNINEKLEPRLKEVFDLVKKEILLANNHTLL
ncbi:hypothetical protein Ancab_007763 [Ancistrocladus abbreviatus]